MRFIIEDEFYSQILIQTYSQMSNDKKHEDLIKNLTKTMKEIAGKPSFDESTFSNFIKTGVSNCKTLVEKHLMILCCSLLKVGCDHKIDETEKKDNRVAGFSGLAVFEFLYCQCISRHVGLLTGEMKTSVKYFSTKKIDFLLEGKTKYFVEVMASIDKKEEDSHCERFNGKKTENWIIHGITCDTFDTNTLYQLLRQNQENQDNFNIIYLFHDFKCEGKLFLFKLMGDDEYSALEIISTTKDSIQDQMNHLSYNLNQLTYAVNQLTSDMEEIKTQLKLMNKKISKKRKRDEEDIEE